MNEHKNDLAGLSTRALRARRRRLAARLGDVEAVLAGSLVEQIRRCGKPGCRCAEGDPHGPYAYFVPEFFRSMLARSMRLPTTITSDGAPGLIKEGYAKASLKKYRPIAARNEDKKVFSGLL